MPGHRLDMNYPDEATLTLNERFFNDVRALIKRRLQENAAVRISCCTAAAAPQQEQQALSKSLSNLCFP